jgi:hypothetical protein
MFRHRISALALAAILLTGCKIEIIVPEGGSVVTRSGSFRCLAGQTCLIDVYDLYFSQDFVAKPDSGYTFDKWKKTYRGFCGGKSKSCNLYTSELDDYPALMAFLESDDTFYLEPVFRKSTAAVRITRTYSLASNSTVVYCSNGNSITLPADNQDIQVTQVGNVLKFESMEARSEAYIDSTTEFGYLDNDDGSYQSGAWQLGYSNDAGFFEIIYRDTGWLNDSGLYGSSDINFLYKDRDVACTGSRDFTGSLVSTNKSQIDNSQFPNVGGVYTQKAQDSYITCSDGTSAPAEGGDFTFNVHQKGNAVSLEVTNLGAPPVGITPIDSHPVSGFLDTNGNLSATGSAVGRFDGITGEVNQVVTVNSSFSAGGWSGKLKFYYMMFGDRTSCEEEHRFTGTKLN